MTSGAPSALRGYRLQHLYTLHLLLCHGTGQHREVLLEGTEDLEVFGEGGALLEAVQVKASVASVTPSNLVSVQDSFFARADARLRAAPDALQRVVSFGPFGPEFLAALGGQEPARTRVAAYVALQGVPQDRVHGLLGSMRLTEVAEADLEREVMATLSRLLTGTNPQAAFDALSGWLYRAMELGQRVGAQEVQRRLNAVGRLIHDRSVHRHWFTTIVPLEARALDPEHRARLSGEFLRGASTTFDHVLADLDAPRPDKQRQMTAAFEDAAVVVVHGASGQGKSALAYRFLRDLPPSVWRYEVKRLQDAEQALEVAAAVAGHAGALGVPFTVYFDVPPRNVAWPLLARELARLGNVRVLVTVREEDWQFAQQEGFELEFAEVALDFGPEEARELFGRLARSTARDHLVDFEHAWAAFGGTGPLMEFAYLVTQAVALPKRLAQQVRRLRKEVGAGLRRPGELELLRRVAVVSSFGARLDLAALQQDLRLPDLVQALELLEREYLLRRAPDARLVEGLHPVRSELLAALLTDREVDHTWAATARASLGAVAEEDLEVFLRGAFAARPQHRDALAHGLGALRPHTWEGVTGVTRALLWLGARAFFEANRTIVEEAYGHFSVGWWAMLQLDPAGVHRVAPNLRVNWSEATFLTGAQRRAVADLTARRDDRVDPHGPARTWLQGLALPGAPPTPAAWSAAAEVVFWQRLWQGWPAPQLLFGADAAGAAIRQLSLDAAAEVFFAQAYTPAGEALPAALLELQRVLLERLQVETGTFHLIDDGEVVQAHYIYPHAEVFGGVPRFPSAVPSTPDRPHAHSRWRAELLRRIVPDRQRYGARGHGHLLPQMAWPHDSSDLPGVEASAFLPPWLPRLNSVFHRLIEQELQASTVRAHAEDVLLYRRTVVLAAGRLCQALGAYFSWHHPATWTWAPFDLSPWDDLVPLTRRLAALPEALREPERPGDGSGDRHEAYRSALGQFSSSMRNFGNQVLDALIWVPHLRAPVSPAVRARRKDLAREQCGSADPGRLPTVNLSDACGRLEAFQQAFRLRFGWTDGNLAALEGEERAALTGLLQLWTLFAYHAGRRFADPGREAERRFCAPRDDARSAVERSAPALKRFLARARVLSDTLPWHGQAAVWIALELDDPLLISLALPALQGALSAAFPALSGHNLRYVALERGCAHLLIVPLYQGRMAEHLVWEASTVRLADEARTPLPFVDRELPPDTAGVLGLASDQRPELFEGHALQAAYALLSCAVSYARIVFGAVGDAPDSPVFQAVWSDTAAQVHTTLEQALDAAVQQIRRIAQEVFDHEGALDTRDGLRQIAENLPHILSAALPPGARETGTGISAELSAVILAQWEAQMGRQAWLVDEVRLAWLSDALLHSRRATSA